MLADLSASPATPIDRTTRRVPSLHWSTSSGGVSTRAEDIVIESPLCIEVAYTRGVASVVKNLGITMRTPGADEELALGFLLGESVVTSLSEVRAIDVLASNAAGEKIETCRISLAQPPRNDLQRIARVVTTTSACGLCGRGTMEGLPLDYGRATKSEFAAIPRQLIIALPERLRLRQTAFAVTGGSHGAALSDRCGEILLSREDVGRHNAVDKLFGAALIQDITLPECLLVLSGRASFELVQKSASAGVRLVAAVGAPSSAAVDLAHAAGITLIGFVRENRFNIYTHATRVALE